MKKHIVLIFFTLLVSYSLFSQIEKGSSMMGFNLNGNYSQHKNNTGFKTFSYTSGFGINPNVGYFIRKNTCVGISTGYMYTKQFSNNYIINNPALGVFDTDYVANKNVINEFHIGLFFRKYFFLNSQFALATHLSTSANYSLIKSTTQSDLFNKTIYSYNIAFNVGLSPTMIYFPHPQYGIELSYGYIGYNYNATYFNHENISNEDGFKFNFGPNTLQLGFHFYMFKKSSTTKK